MAKDNLLSRLQESDFLEFAVKAGIITKRYKVFEISNRDDGEVLVTYKRKFGFFKNENEEYRYRNVYYYEFAYFIPFASRNKKQNILWRKFVAEKLGAEYISAYEEMRRKEIEEKYKNIDNLKKKYAEEIEKLRKNEREK